MQCLTETLLIFRCVYPTLCWGYPHSLGSHPIQCHPLAPQTMPAPANCSYKALLLFCPLISWCCGTGVLSALCNLLSCALVLSTLLGSIRSKLCCLVLWAGWAFWEVKAVVFLAFSALHSAVECSAGAWGCSCCSWWELSPTLNATLPSVCFCIIKAFLCLVVRVLWWFGLGFCLYC